MTAAEDNTTVVAYEPSLGRLARTGTWEQLAQGTFRSAIERLAAGDTAAAADLVAVSVLEADELRDIYQRWPAATTEWLLDRGVSAEAIGAEIVRLGLSIGASALEGIQAHWPQFTAAVDKAVADCESGAGTAADAIEHARAVWQSIHDRAVDRVSGVIDIAVRLAGEDCLGALWDFLMDDWYRVHESRYALTNQPWPQSAHQLMVAIVDGFHAHLTGTGRQGDIEIVHEQHRTGFRFAPCGSGGRSLDTRITDGDPRAGTPYGFAVTTTPHDWAWNTVGICSYCVHCCQLNEVMPIDRLGYPTRVIDAPTWTPDDPVTSCTWWVYHDPADVPDHVYERVGRDPARRPTRTTDGAGHD